MRAKRSRSAWRFLAASLLAMSTGGAGAQAPAAPPAPDPLFAEYVASDVYRSYLEQAFNFGEPARLKAECAALRVLEANRVLVLEPPRFEKQGEGFRVASGSWIAVVILDRCGAFVKRRAVLIVEPRTGNIEPVFLLPGEFRGNIQLERDARRIVLPGIAGQAQCDADKVVVLDVRPLTPADPAGWSEVWIAEACGKTVEATVTYAGVPGGMNVSAGSWKVR